MPDNEALEPRSRCIRYQHCPLQVGLHIAMHSKKHNPSRDAAHMHRQRSRRSDRTSSNLRACGSRIPRSRGLQMRSVLRILGMVGLSLNPTAATWGTPSECHEPLQESPAWTYIPQRVVDSWTGAYHDAHSGAFLVFDV